MLEKRSKGGVILLVIGLCTTQRKVDSRFPKGGAHRSNAHTTKIIYMKGRKNDEEIETG